jgi:beta-lactamase superfamily II metal-dependent hydrolase
VKRIGLLVNVAAVVAMLAAFVRPVSAAQTLDIYFIDVEGGQSTLIVTPAGESLLVDTGYAGFDGRDARRILAAALDAGIERIDYLLVTHFHQDHDGGVVELSRQMPITTFIDHGDLIRSKEALAESRWPATVAAYDAYVSARTKGKHVEPKPGDRLPLKGVEAVWVSSAAATIRTAIAGGGQTNPACGPAAPAAQETLENPRSTGFHLRFGRFRFVDLGDLSGAPLFALVCPKSMLGPVDLYLVPHHGGTDASYPATFAAVTPRVAIVNNGATKGGSPEALATLRRVQGLEDTWQLHRSQHPGAQNVADERIANLDESTAHWIKASASEDGSFTVTNGRTGAIVNYKPRR